MVVIIIVVRLSFLDSVTTEITAAAHSRIFRNKLLHVCTIKQLRLLLAKRVEARLDLASEEVGGVGALVPGDFAGKRWSVSLLSFSFSLSLSLSLSLSHIHTHTYTSKHTHTHTHTLSLSVSFQCSPRWLLQNAQEILQVRKTLKMRIR